MKKTIKKSPKRKSAKPKGKKVTYSKARAVKRLVKENQDFMTFKEASEWATNHLKKSVTTSNISYLVQYGRVKKYGENGTTRIRKADLVKYYESYNGRREVSWKKQLGGDLNWQLSFDQVREIETTKHVHRLHPYKGKFIPQLVEYFLDDHIDSFKKETYFSKGDIVLDPFCGSGTTLVQSSELGLHAIGIDVSEFNALITNVKIGKHDLSLLRDSINTITESLKKLLSSSHSVQFESRLLEELYKFNNLHFPVPGYKYKVKRREIDEDKYGNEKANKFLPIFTKLVKEYKIALRQDHPSQTFLEKWYSEHVLSEIGHVFEEIKRVKEKGTQDVLRIILSRTIRSCRATTHSDLATLLEPVTSTYYCTKHGKICKPLFSILKWWEFYSQDTIKRLDAFDKLRTLTHQLCLTGDSRTMDIASELESISPQMAEMVQEKKIDGIFSSPPYVGLIDYHEQHAYAYDLFQFERRDELEIGRMYRGQGKEARDSYAKGVSDVLNNCKRFLAKDYDVFLVANDRFNLYPGIAAMSGMQIVNQFKRPVLNRTEKDKGAYSEIIFHLKSES